MTTFIELHDLDRRALRAEARYIQQQGFGLPLPCDFLTDGGAHVKKPKRPSTYALLAKARSGHLLSSDEVRLLKLLSMLEAGHILTEEERAELLALEAA